MLTASARSHSSNVLVFWKTLEKSICSDAPRHRYGVVTVCAFSKVLRNTKTFDASVNRALQEAKSKTGSVTYF